MLEFIREWQTSSIAKIFLKKKTGGLSPPVNVLNVMNIVTLALCQWNRIKSLEVNVFVFLAH
jgi:hypothetical protein